MINRLSNPINRNRSAAEISKVMSSNTYSEEIVTMRFKSLELNKSILEYDAWD